jgi:hypothetical protein
MTENPNTGYDYFYVFMPNYIFIAKLHGVAAKQQTSIDREPV